MGAASNVGHEVSIRFVPSKTLVALSSILRRSLVLEMTIAIFWPLDLLNPSAFVFASSLPPF
jgi:hypothetical protein